MNSASKKIENLFRYLLELEKQKVRISKNLADEKWFCDFSSIPQYEDYVKTFSWSKYPNSASLQSDTQILQVRNTTLDKCPTPDHLIRRYLGENWGDINCRIDVSDFEELETGDISEKGNASTAVRTALNNWILRRDRWRSSQRRKDRVIHCFEDLFRVRQSLKKQSESLELVLGFGFLRDLTGAINYPLLFRKVEISFDPARNLLSVVDIGGPTEFNGRLLEQVQEFDLEAVSVAKNEIDQNESHFLSYSETSDFLKRLSRSLSVKCHFLEGESGTVASDLAKYSIDMRRALILRRKLGGREKSISRILSALNGGVRPPRSLSRIVDPNAHEMIVEQGREELKDRLALASGESEKILLTKPANREQVRIAEKIARYDAVLVQGPPGTGKTHTIANLLGNFLADGKSVLVTSYTRKALGVLKEKIHPELQGLCVSYVGEDRGDLEKTVAEIFERFSTVEASALESIAAELERERHAIFTALDEIRAKLFKIRNREHETIAIDGRYFSPISAAQFVAANQSLDTVIPEPVVTGAPFPLSPHEIVDLYASNELLREADESELINLSTCKLEIPTPSALRDIKRSVEGITADIESISKIYGWQIFYDDLGFAHKLRMSTSEVNLSDFDPDKVATLEARLKSIEDISSWQMRAAIDGATDKYKRRTWLALIDSIHAVNQKLGQYLDVAYGHEVILPSTSVEFTINLLSKIIDEYEEKGSVSRLWFFRLSQEEKDAYRSIYVDGKLPSTLEHYRMALLCTLYLQQRASCADLWDRLMQDSEVPSFFALSREYPEQVALRTLTMMEQSLDWVKNELPKVENELREVGVSLADFSSSSRFESERVSLVKQLEALLVRGAEFVHLLKSAEALFEVRRDDKRNIAQLQKGLDSGASIYRGLLESYMERATDEYAGLYAKFEEAKDLSDVAAARRRMIARVRECAPEWANALKNRKGLHGREFPPDRLEEAWVYKQLAMELDHLSSEEEGELKSRSETLQNDLQLKTAELASRKAWSHLISRIGSDLGKQQALQGWYKAVERIGKGTGKSAPKYRRIARQRMMDCQSAVPVWIMSIDDALTMFDPVRNHFDVVIIDEASQAGVSALPILFMARKAIIVGDDKQVSPSGIGMTMETVDRLNSSYLEDVIPNAHLYTQDASLYEIAATTYRPLMLREHFRCVPEIIEFSNDLCYQGKIKPLRNANEVLLPAVINHRVINGERSQGKTNLKEAQEIVSIIKACCEAEEYRNLSFGVISLLGGEQAELIERLAIRYIGSVELEKRNFLCGTASEFQGDERDVVWLSMVDSPNAEGNPLRMRSDTNVTTQRYNVAASRAREQLWVVNSLDFKRDLKDGDMRRRLLEYSDDPGAVIQKYRSIEAESESPFEEEIAKALVSKHYRIVQQFPVGSYRLDIVVQSASKSVCIECDGDRYHSGSEKIKADMERQLILERVGWKFVRLRGSEYYRDKNAAIGRLLDELTRLEIFPEEYASKESTSRDRTSNLLSAIRRKAEEIRGKFFESAEAVSLMGSVVSNVSEPQERLQPECDARSDKDGTGSEAESVVSYGQEVADSSLVDEKVAAQPSLLAGLDSVTRSPQEQDSVPQESSSEPSFSSQDEATAEVEQLLARIELAKLEKIDLTNRGGALWVVGNRDLAPVMKAITRGTSWEFRFSPHGGKASGGRPGWWLRIK